MKWSINGVITKVAWNFSVVCSLSQDAKCIGVGPGQRFKGGSEVYPTRWTWVWVNSGSWWWTGRPGVLQSMGNWTELNWGIYSILRSKIAGLKDMCSCVWLNYVLTDYFLKFWVFFNVLSHSQNTYVPLLNILADSCITGFNFCQFGRCAVVSHCGFNLDFPDDLGNCLSHVNLLLICIFCDNLLVQISIVSVKHSL